METLTDHLKSSGRKSKIYKEEIDITEYYNDEDLDRFGEVSKFKPDLFRKFIYWYNLALVLVASNIMRQGSNRPRTKARVRQNRKLKN